MQEQGAQGYDEVDAFIRQRQEDALVRFQNVSPNIHKNIKLIRGIESQSTDEEKALVDKCGGQVIREEEAQFSGELQNSFFLFQGVEVCKFVGKICLENQVHGTGFMISKRLLLTCHHVFNPTNKKPSTGFVRFGNIDPFPGLPKPLHEAEFSLKPETFYYDNKELDIAIVAVSKKAQNPPNYPLSKIGFCHHVNESGLSIGQHINIIQFPGVDLPQKMILRQNKVLHIDEKYVRFFENQFVDSMMMEDEIDGPEEAAHEYSPMFQHEGDTMPGSSGSCCFDDQWCLIGVHHCSLYVNHKNPQEKKYIANEGISFDAIKNHIEDNIVNANPKLPRYDPKKLGKPFEKPPRPSWRNRFLS